jgi:hypothetical protein
MTFDPNKPGLYPGLLYESYVGAARTNISNLKEMARSPLHYRYRCAHQKESPTLSMGRSAHVAVLEAERFERDYVVWDEVTDAGKMSPRRGKKFEAFCALHPGKTVVAPNEHRFACNVRDALRHKPIARKYLGEGPRELSILWEDVETKMACKGRLDLVTHVEGVDCLVGLKSARSLDPRAFSNQAASLHYYLQWSFYYDGYSTLTGKEPRVVEICIEAEPPFDVVVYVVPGDVLELGREEYRALLSKLRECEQTKCWPGRADNEVLFALPAYMRQDDEEDLGELELEGDARARAVDALNEDL